MKRRTKSCTEMDVVSPYWRRMLGIGRRPGVTATIKRTMRRRERREGKRELTVEH